MKNLKFFLFVLIGAAIAFSLTASFDERNDGLGPVGQFIMYTIAATCIPGIVAAFYYAFKANKGEARGIYNKLDAFAKAGVLAFASMVGAILYQLIF